MVSICAVSGAVVAEISTTQTRGPVAARPAALKLCRRHRQAPESVVNVNVLEKLVDSTRGVPQARHTATVREHFADRARATVDRCHKEENRYRKDYGELTHHSQTQ
eukprot:3019803-Prymnesium_polylepis.1